jgi:hypothetical protein
VTSTHPQHGSKHRRLAFLVAGVVLAAGGADAQTASSRGISMVVTQKSTAYQCYVNTTPSCPLSLGSPSTTTDDAAAPGYGTFDEAFASGIGTISQTSTLAPTELDLAGTIDVYGANHVDCVGGPPYCPYPLMVTDSAGSASSQAEVRFKLIESGQIALSGSVHLVTTPLLYQLGPIPVAGAFHLEVGPEGGPFVYLQDGEIDLDSGDDTFVIDQVLDLPAGEHRIQFAAYALVAVKLFPGGAGFVGSQILLDYDLTATAPGAVAVPSASFGMRVLLVGVLIGVTGWRIARAPVAPHLRGA